MKLNETTRRRVLADMGVQVWLPRTDAVPDVSPDVTVPAAFESMAALGAMRTEVAACTRCGLAKSRKQTVFGVGNPQAEWMFVGEAPGADEDAQGEPFVGRAGQLLNSMIFALGFKREQVYIANVLKCRPPDNRDPEPAEVEQCEPYLVRQIELIRPRLIVALGRHAAHSLTHSELPLSKLRGQLLDYHGTPLVVTYHPAYLLRSPGEKRRAWEDLCFARRIAAQDAHRETHCA